MLCWQFSSRNIEDAVNPVFFENRAYDISPRCSLRKVASSRSRSVGAEGTAKMLPIPTTLFTQQRFHRASLSTEQWCAPAYQSSRFAVQAQCDGALNSKCRSFWRIERTSIHPSFSWGMCRVAFWISDAPENAAAASVPHMGYLSLTGIQRARYLVSFIDVLCHISR